MSRLLLSTKHTLEWTQKNHYAKEKQDNILEVTSEITFLQWQAGWMSVDGTEGMNQPSMSDKNKNQENAGEADTADMDALLMW